MGSVEPHAIKQRLMEYIINFNTGTYCKAFYNNNSVTDNNIL